MRQCVCKCAINPFINHSIEYKLCLILGDKLQLRSSVMVLADFPLVCSTLNEGSALSVLSSMEGWEVRRVDLIALVYVVYCNAHGVAVTYDKVGKILKACRNTRSFGFVNDLVQGLLKRGYLARGSQRSPLVITTSGRLLLSRYEKILHKLAARGLPGLPNAAE